MAATEDQIAELRRMVNEPDEGTYTDETLTVYIERYPLVDAAGNEPDDDGWTATYNLYAAAADILMEKAAKAAEKFDFSDGPQTFNMSQTERALRLQAEMYRTQADRQMARLYT